MGKRTLCDAHHKKHVISLTCISGHIWYTQFNESDYCSELIVEVRPIIPYVIIKL